MTAAVPGIQEVGRQTLHSSTAMLGPIVVASDGSAPAATALALARLLRERTGAPIRVVSVVEPTAAVVPAPLLLQQPVPESRVQLRHDVVREQVDRIIGNHPEVPIDIEVGWPPEVLAQFARDRAASFFVAGLVHHGRMERMARTETPLSVLRGAHAPVLALPWGMMREPRCVVVAVDLTEASIIAVRHAMPLMQAAERVYLVHVQEPVAPLSELPVVPEYDDAAARQAIANVAEALDVPVSAVVDTRILIGHPAFELADFADHVQADLLVLGHHPRGLWGRLLHSSVAERVYRLANCGVLIVPTDGVALAAATDDAREVVTYSVADRDRWPTVLKEFTERNAGRRVSVEVFTPDLGAQAASVNYPLMGVAYDPAADAIDVMLGDTEQRSRRVTHAVPGVTGVELSGVVGGADTAMSLVHDGGETLLTFSR